MRDKIVTDFMRKHFPDWKHCESDDNSYIFRLSSRAEQTPGELQAEFKEINTKSPKGGAQIRFISEEKVAEKIIKSKKRIPASYVKFKTQLSIPTRSGKKTVDIFWRFKHTYGSSTSSRSTGNNRRSRSDSIVAPSAPRPGEFFGTDQLPSTHLPPSQFSSFAHSRGGFDSEGSEKDEGEEDDEEGDEEEEAGHGNLAPLMQHHPLGNISTMMGAPFDAHTGPGLFGSAASAPAPFGSAASVEEPDFFAHSGSSSPSAFTPQSRRILGQPIKPVWTATQFSKEHTLQYVTKPYQEQFSKLHPRPAGHVGARNEPSHTSFGGFGESYNDQLGDFGESYDGRFGGFDGGGFNNGGGGGDSDDGFLGHDFEGGHHDVLGHPVDEFAHMNLHPSQHSQQY